MQIQQKEIAAPFSSNFSPQLPELLDQLACTIALTTYQAGKLVFISANPNRERLYTLPRTFDKPMGVAVQGDKMVLSTKDEVILLENSRALAQHYPNSPFTYDSMWVPRTTFHTGQVDMHDIAFGSEGIFAVNTSFSCLCRVDSEYNFVPVWKPPFISKLASEDRCHLNGMVMIDGKPKYATALGATNTPQGWRDGIASGGLLIDVETNEVILEGLAMPHSPCVHNGELYMLLSASGEFVKVNPEAGTYKVLKQYDGFCRGLSIYGDYAFIGFSKLRKNSSTFAQLPFSDQANFAGIKMIHLPTGSEVGNLTFAASVDEIYEVLVLPGMIRPNILNTTNPIHKRALAIPGATFWAGSTAD